MARKPTVGDPAHRKVQQDYRGRLLVENVPEVGRVDTAAAVAFYAYLRKLKEEQRGAAGKADADFLLRTALDVLVKMGRERRKRPEPYNRKGSLRVLRRRLVRASERFDRLLGDPEDDDVVHLVSCP